MSFAGCVRDVKYATTKTPDLVLEDIDLSVGVQENVGVQMGGCYDKVRLPAKGLRRHLFICLIMCKERKKINNGSESNW